MLGDSGSLLVSRFSRLCFKKRVAQVAEKILKYLNRFYKFIVSSMTASVKMLDINIPEALKLEPDRLTRMHIKYKS